MPSSASKKQKSSLGPIHSSSRYCWSRFTSWYSSTVNARLRFFFNDTANTDIYTLSLHDALPIFQTVCRVSPLSDLPILITGETGTGKEDRKSTRLNSSHGSLSYAVFCLKKK